MHPRILFVLAHDGPILGPGDMGGMFLGELVRAGNICGVIARLDVWPPYPVIVLLSTRHGLLLSGGTLISTHACRQSQRMRAAMTSHHTMTHSRQRWFLFCCAFDAA